MNQETRPSTGRTGRKSDPWYHLRWREARPLGEVSCDLGPCNVGQLRPGLLDPLLDVVLPGGSGTIFDVLSGAGSTKPRPLCTFQRAYSFRQRLLFAYIEDSILAPAVSSDYGPSRVHV